VADYIGEELRLTGLFVGDVPMPGLNMCGEAGISTIMHTNGALTNPDMVQILTSERITTTASGVPFLQTSAVAAKGNNTFTVNAKNSDVSAIHANAGTGQNARAFITFDTLQPNLGTLVYQVTSYSNNILTVSPSLDQQVNSLSNAYAVVRKQFSVDANRNLMLVRWDATCDSSNGNGLTEELVYSWGPDNKNGGVDGFKVEYTLANGNATNVLQTSDIVNVRAVTVWVLLKADFPSNTYMNTGTYQLGSFAPVTHGPYNDPYRRVLVTKTVEVKNAAL
jgi:stress response protein SCP2